MRIHLMFLNIVFWISICIAASQLPYVAPNDPIFDIFKKFTEETLTVSIHHNKASYIKVKRTNKNKTIENFSGIVKQSNCNNTSGFVYEKLSVPGMKKDNLERYEAHISIDGHKMVDKLVGYRTKEQFEHEECIYEVFILVFACPGNNLYPDVEILTLHTKKNCEKSLLYKAMKHVNIPTLKKNDEHDNIIAKRAARVFDTNLKSIFETRSLKTDTKCDVCEKTFDFKAFYDYILYFMYLLEHSENIQKNFVQESVSKAMPNYLTKKINKKS